MMNFGYSQANEQETQAVSRSFISSVFSWMGIGLGITAFVAWYFADKGLFMYLIDPLTHRMSGWGWVVMFAPFGFVLLINAGINRFSSQTLVLLFAAFAILMGMSLSFIFIAYTAASIFKTFIITAGMFGVMAVTGYTTKTDLSKFGSIMMMGLVGIIIASLVNMFMHSGGLEYIISFIGVLVFTGLTAYDVQKLKQIGAGVGYGNETASKLAIMGALTLYLDFINLFLFLLRFFGGSRD